MIEGSLIIIGIGILTLIFGFILYFIELTGRSKILLVIGTFILVTGITLLILAKAGIFKCL